jgi:hypothetical protein
VGTAADAPQHVLGSHRDFEVARMQRHALGAPVNESASFCAHASTPAPVGAGSGGFVGVRTPSHTLTVEART